MVGETAVDRKFTSHQGFVLGALLVIYAFSTIDRVILSIVQESVKNELGLTDFELGMLGGPAFIVLYTLSSLPIARLAEKRNRIAIVAAGAALWSAKTTACGFAQGYMHLFWARLTVGLGEASCVPASQAILSDTFPPERRGAAFGIYGLAIPIGTVVASVVAGYIAANANWRMAFWVLGIPGLLAALFLFLTVKDPGRQRSASAAPSFVEAMKILAHKRTFWHMSAGGALIAVFSYPLGQFLPSFMIRNYGLDMASASYAFGFIFSVSVGVGTFLGGFLSERLTPLRPAAMTWLPAVGALLALPLYGLAFLQSSPMIGLLFLGLAPMLHMFWFACLYAVGQNVSPSNMRATASGLLLTIFNLVGYGIGPPLVGKLADVFAAQRIAAAGLTQEACTAGPQLAACASASGEGLRLAMLCSLVFLAWAAAHFLLARRTYVKDCEG